MGSRESGTGSAKDLKLGIELGLPEAQLRYISGLSVPTNML